jgi:hypothetical protein
MGINADITFDLLSGDEPEYWHHAPECAWIEVNEADHLPGTHEVFFHRRIGGFAWLYHTIYTRGPWPLFAAVMMVLHASENVGDVWYGVDGDVRLFTPGDVSDLTDFYMEHGTRPYNKGLPTPRHLKSTNTS